MGSCPDTDIDPGILGRSALRLTTFFFFFLSFSNSMKNIIAIFDFFFVISSVTRLVNTFLGVLYCCIR